MATVTDKLTAKDFLNIAEEMVNDLVAVFGLLTIELQETLEQALDENWSIDELIDTAEEMFVPGSDEPVIVNRADPSFEKITGAGKKKQYLDRLKDRYGWSGGQLNDIMSEVLEFNREKIRSRVTRVQGESIKNKASKLKEGSRLIFPDDDELLPARSIFVGKAAQDGQLIEDTVRDSMTLHLRKAVEENGLVYSRGAIAGRVDRRTITAFETELGKVMDEYAATKGTSISPSKIHQIAVTEVRTAADAAKFSYAERVAQLNSDVIQAAKRWIHNNSLSKNPRASHVKMDRETKSSPIPINDHFVMDDGARLMHPHDVSAPPEHTINCNCDFDIVFVQKS